MPRILLLASLISCWLVSPVAMASPDGRSAVYQAAHRLFENVQSRGAELPRNYVTLLLIESAFDLSQVTGDPQYGAWAEQWLSTRSIFPETLISWRTEPFENISYVLWRESLDPRAEAHFLDETAALRQMIPRNAKGAILHQHRDNPGRLLIDRLQAVMLRFAQAGDLTQDSAWFQEVGRQADLYAAELRDPRNGLYSQGRGWAGPPEEMLSPGAWSRGHGWLMRGFVKSLDYLPRNSESYRAVQGHLEDLAEALLPLQDPEGVWHALLDQPWEDSAVESSGTGLIAGYLLRAVRLGHLPEYPYREAAMRAVDSLTGFVDSEGIVLHACPGPGPLYSISGYYNQAFHDDEAHGRFALMVAFTEALPME